MIGQAPGNGINGDYDGSYRSRNMLKYKKTVGDVDLYALICSKTANTCRATACATSVKAAVPGWITI
jgi:hypothetical protein